MGVRRLGRDLLINGFVMSSLLPRSARWRLLRLCGMEIEGWCAVSPGCWFGGRDIRIGRGSTVNYGVFFDNAARIDIGNNVDIGMQTMLITGTHGFGDSTRRAGPSSVAPVTVEDGTWIGARAVILPGVRIGSGCVIAAGSVVTKDCQPDGVYAGVPAVRVRDL